MLYSRESDDHRDRYVPDVIAAHSERKQLRLHQFRGQGIEVATWRRNPKGEWVRSKEALRLKKWEAIGLIRCLRAVMKDREGKRLGVQAAEAEQG